eukprot:Opistho-2@37608
MAWATYSARSEPAARAAMNHAMASIARCPPLALLWRCQGVGARITQTDIRAHIVHTSRVTQSAHCPWGMFLRHSASASSARAAVDGESLSRADAAAAAGSRPPDSADDGALRRGPVEDRAKISDVMNGTCVDVRIDGISFATLIDSAVERGSRTSASAPETVVPAIGRRQVCLMRARPEDVDAAPISISEFAQAVEKCGLKKTDSVALAVSGGVDSMALALLSVRYFNSAYSMTIDHGLREESTEEAQTVRNMLSSIGMDGAILRVDWGHQGAPSTAIQEVARSLRYTLLSRECAQTGRTKLLAAHHLDDQLETVARRLFRESHVDGLAAMRTTVPMAEFGLPHITLNRPLLSFPKERLVATCAKYGQAWAEDPSNGKLVYQRNRIRSAINELGEDGRRALATINLAAVNFTADIGRVVEDACKKTLRVSRRYGYAEVDLDLFSALAPSVATRVLMLVVGSMGASERPGRAIGRMASIFRERNFHPGGNVFGGAVAISGSHSGAQVPHKAMFYTPAEDIHSEAVVTDGPFASIPVFSPMHLPKSAAKGRYPPMPSHPGVALVMRHLHTLSEMGPIPLPAEAMDERVGFVWDKRWNIKLLRKDALSSSPLSGTQRRTGSHLQAPVDDVRCVDGIVHARGRPLYVCNINDKLMARLSASLLFIRAPRLVAMGLPVVVDGDWKIIAIPDVGVCQIFGYRVTATFQPRRLFPECPFIFPPEVPVPRSKGYRRY